MAPGRTPVPVRGYCPPPIGAVGSLPRPCLDGDSASLMDVWHLILLGLGSVVAGAVNTLAGGGSLITVPLLILVGLEPNAANATNRVGVLAQSLVSSWTFARQGLGGWGRAAALLPTGLGGAAVGAWGATVIDNDAFRTVFGWLMLPLAVVLFVNPRPRRWLRDRAEAAPSRGVVLSVAFFFVGAYAGFVQAGYGFAALAALTLLGAQDLRSANAVKVLLSAAFTALSLVIFSFRLEIDLAAGLVVAVGSGLGGYAGGIAAVRKGELWIRPVVLVSCIALAIHLLRGG